MGSTSTSTSGVALLALVALYCCCGSATAINCYSCISTDSTQPFVCNEFMTEEGSLQLESCDSIYGAKYCVKQVGRFEVVGLSCYQCTSAEEWKCMDGNLVVDRLEPKSCSHVHGARYCVQSVGRYGGGIGTKRFCSSIHQGNYCDDVRQNGDTLLYRTCVYTCDADGCNPATWSTIADGRLVLLLAIFASLASNR